MRKRGIWRGAKYQSYVPTSTSTTSTPLDSDSEPMQVGRTRISAEERRRRRETNSCFYCGNAGHFASRCPLKGNAHPYWGYGWAWQANSPVLRELCFLWD